MVFSVYAQDVGWVHTCFPAPILQGGFATSLDPPARTKTIQSMKGKKQSSSWSRTRRLHIRLTTEEKIKISGLAKEHGLKISDFVRVTIVRSQPIMPMAKPDRALFITTLGQLGKIGSNINQIAHQMHRQRVVGNGIHVPEKLINDALSSVKTLSDHLHLLLQDGTAQ